MKDGLAFKEVYKIDGHGLVVIFSDGTLARYTVADMAGMRPEREPVGKVEDVLG